MVWENREPGFGGQLLEKMSVGARGRGTQHTFGGWADRFRATLPGGGDNWSQSESGSVLSGSESGSGAGLPLSILGGALEATVSLLGLG